MSLRHWSAVLKYPISLLALKNSLFLALVGATLGVVLSIFVAYVIVKVKTRASGILESLSCLLFSFPDIVSAWILLATMFVRELRHAIA